jgi:hypothetical protein
VEYYYRDQIVNEMGGACSTNGKYEKEKTYKM